MTKPFTATSLAIAIFLPAAAQAADFASIDANGDGAVSMSEFQTAMPEAPSDAFTAADTDADGALSDEEFATAQEAGTIPSSDG